MSFLPYVIAAWLFLVGLYGVATSRNRIHLVVCLSVAQSATYVVLVAIGYRTGAGAPVFQAVAPGTPAVDPVVQALTLTSVVIGVATLSLALALVIQLARHYRTLDLRRMRELRG